MHLRGPSECREYEKNDTEDEYAWPCAQDHNCGITRPKEGMRERSRQACITTVRQRDAGIMDADTS
jgi:hypothetical protein